MQIACVQCNAEPCIYLRDNAIDLQPSVVMLMAD